MYYLSPVELHRSPIVRLIIPFIAGILVGYYFSLNLWLIAILLGLSLVSLTASAFARPKFQTFLSLSSFTGVGINFILFFTGLAAIYFSNHTNFNSHITQKKKCDQLLVKLLENPEEKNKTWRVYGQVESGYTNGKADRTFGRVVLYFNKEKYDSTLVYGDYILINNTLEKPSSPLNPGEFDYARWLENQDVYRQAFLKHTDYIKTGENKTNPIYSLANTARSYFNTVLKTNMPDSATYGVASALILGQRNYVADELTDAYSRTGTIHVLAVSGLHVAAVYFLLSTLLVSFRRNKTLLIIRTLIILCGLWGYAVLTGLAPSINRAAIMLSFVVVGEAMGRKTNLYNSLAASALFILCLDAKAIFNIGFQLSYLAVLGIGVMYYPVYRLISIKNKLLDYPWQLICVSLAAQIATFPLCIYYFHQFPNYFLVSNLIIVPLGTLAVFSGILLFVVSPFPALAVWAGKLLHYIILSCNKTAVIIESWPNSYTNFLYLSIAGTILVYLIITSLGIYISGNKKVFLITSLSCAVILAGMALYRSYDTYHDTEFTIYALPGNQKAISYVHKNEVWLWADSTITQNSKTYRQKIEPHLIYANAGKIHFARGDSLVTNNFSIYGGRYIALHGLKIVWADKKVFIPNENWDMLVTDAAGLKKLDGNITADTLILTGTFKLDEQNGNVYEMARYGAYRIKFNYE